MREHDNRSIFHAIVIQTNHVAVPVKCLAAVQYAVVVDNGHVAYIQLQSQHQAGEVKGKRPELKNINPLTRPP